MYEFARMMHCFVGVEGSLVTEFFQLLSTLQARREEITGLASGDSWRYRNIRVMAVS